MTGFRSKFLRHKCARDGCYVEQLPLWDDLIAALPAGMRPTDVDGLLEIGGHFLFLEEKRAGAGPDEGQRRALRALARLPNHTVVLFRPGRNSEQEVLLYTPAGEPQGWQPWTRERLLKWVGTWAAVAQGCWAEESAEEGA